MNLFFSKKNTRNYFIFILYWFSLCLVSIIFITAAILKNIFLHLFLHLFLLLWLTLLLKSRTSGRFAILAFCLFFSCSPWRFCCFIIVRCRIWVLHGALLLLNFWLWRRLLWYWFGTYTLSAQYSVLRYWAIILLELITKIISIAHTGIKILFLIIFLTRLLFFNWSISSTREMLPGSSF